MSSMIGVLKERIPEMPIDSDISCAARLGEAMCSCILAETSGARLSANFDSHIVFANTPVQASAQAAN